MSTVRKLIVAVLSVLLVTLAVSCTDATASVHHRHHRAHPCAKFHHKHRRECRIRHHLPVPKHHKHKHHKPKPHKPVHIVHKDATSQPNIVMVLVDDFSMNLLQYMPNVQALQDDGMTFTNATVSDSLCCPSRTTIFTGEYPHNHDVVDNTINDNGGYLKFLQSGDEDKSFAPYLYGAGYTTGFIGKYLNQYNPNDTANVVTNWPNQGSYNQPGWSYWAAFGEGAYNQYKYDIAFTNGPVYHGNDDSDYATSVEGSLASAFITRNTTAGRPFFLEMAPFATHVATGPRNPDVPHFEYNYEMAPGDYNCHTNVDGTSNIPYPADSSWNAISQNAPMWERDFNPWGQTMLDKFTEDFRQRVCQTKAVDRWVGRLRQQLVDQGVSNNTYFIFTSDNGLHMGEHRLNENKMTAFDSDVNVPLIIAGPGVKPGSTDNHYVQNTDFAPTFMRIAGVTPPSTVDGHSLLPLLNNPGTQQTWRTFATIEHTQPAYDPNDPDSQPVSAFNPPSYVALRGINLTNGTEYTYVQYKDGEHEYYNRTADPDEMNNLYPSLTDARRQQLSTWVDNVEGCGGSGTNYCYSQSNPNTY